MRTGIFGGTFDPPHLGHLILAAEAHFQLALDELLWVLTPAPPHKRDQTITPAPLRLQMVQAAIGSDPAFRLSRVDLERPPPHYAIDTVRLIKERTTQGEVIYVMGGDSLRDLPTWHRPREFLEACDGLGVMRRPGAAIDLSDLEEEFPGLGSKVRFVDAPLLEISSSQIRRRIAEGRPYRYYLPSQVFQIIQRARLYLNKT